MDLAYVEGPVIGAEHGMISCGRIALGIECRRFELETLVRVSIRRNTNV